MNTHWKIFLNGEELAILKNIIANYKLSIREADVALLWLQDYSYRQISTELQISEHTARTIIKNIHLKLDVHSKTSLLLKLIKEHLL